MLERTETKTKGGEDRLGRDTGRRTRGTEDGVDKSGEGADVVKECQRDSPVQSRPTFVTPFVVTESVMS